MSVQTIYSQKLKYGNTIVNAEEANKLYNQITAQWNNEHHSIWAFDWTENRLVGMSLDDFVSSVGGAFQFQIANGSLKCLKENNTETVARDGRKWYQLIVQPTSDEDLETVACDNVSLLVCGLMVSGFVYHFNNENERNVMYNRLHMKCMCCGLRTPQGRFGRKMLCVKCANTPVNPVASVGLTAKQVVEIISKPPTEVDIICDQIKKENEERLANDWAVWLINNEPEPVKVVVKPKNPPKDPNRKNIPPKPPATIRSPAGCPISNHLAVKKWMDKYGNK